MTSSSTFSSSPSESTRVTRRGKVSAEHTLNRVRENQRRHRARRRDHIASLEEKLAETERLLEEARNEIKELRAERDLQSKNLALVPRRANPNDGYVLSEDNVWKIAIEGVAPDAGTSLPTPLPLSPISQTSIVGCRAGKELGQSQEPILRDDQQRPRLTLLLPFDISSPPPGPPPCCTDTPLTSEEVATSPSTLVSVSTPAGPECSSCATRPPPSPSESVTLCSQACVLISQQNFRGIDPVTIRAWLYQGYRRAQSKGEGCSVENGTLMSLLDFISGV